MAFGIYHSLVMTAPDDPTFENNPSDWNAALVLKDATSGGLLYASSTTAVGCSALLAAGGLVVGGGAGTAPLTYANLTYTETLANSGPGLKVGTSGTSTGLVIGYTGTSGQGGIWHSHATITTTNWSFVANGTDTILNAPTSGGAVRFYSNGSQRGVVGGAAGFGASITAGTATTDVQALSATQTWNAAGVAFTGWKFTITDTASAAGSLAMQILGGAAATTVLFSVGKSGDGTFGGDLYLQAGSEFRFGVTSTILRAVSGDGTLRLTNAARNDFTLLQLGGTTSSFPALKRSSAKLLARLADDSAAATFEGKYNSSDGTAGVASFGPSAVASITVKDGIITAIS